MQLQIYQAPEIQQAAGIPDVHAEAVRWGFEGIHHHFLCGEL